MRTRAIRDYYAALGVATTATEEEIKRAYRRLALQHHPDRNPSSRRQAEERFKQISEAYAILMDPARRRAYDDQRREPRPGAGPPPGAPRWREEDVFRDLFSDRRSASVFDDLGAEWARQGLRFDEAFLREVFFSGRGAVVIGPFGVRWIGRFGPRAAAERVGEPGKGGDVVPSLPGFLGWAWSRLKEAVTAPFRGARGALGSGPSPRGDLQYEMAVPAGELSRGGRFRLTIERSGHAEELVVTVPAGLRPGTRLRLRGKGEPGRDGRTGDLYLHVRPRA